VAVADFVQDNTVSRGATGQFLGQTREGAEGGPFTFIVRPTVAVPAWFFAVTIYDAEAVAAVGVPVTAPVALLIVKPAGRAGVTVKLSTTPVTVAVFVVIATVVQ